MAPLLQQNGHARDFWSPKAYATSAPFVAVSSPKLVQYLNAQPGERILDIGCGDGDFTNNFIANAGYVLGVDASPGMIAAANERYGSKKAEFRVLDCCFLETDPSVINGSFDKAISNSALHWILRDEATRISTFQNIYLSLKPGGAFYFEFGCQGHVSEVFTALLFMLVHHGIPMQEAKKINRWFFPSKEWTKKSLESVGFVVETMEVDYRPTKLTDAEDGGLAGWINLLGAPMVDALPPSKREAAVKEVCEILEPVVERHEDGTQWLGYVRLRGIARKP